MPPDAGAGRVVPVGDLPVHDRCSIDLAPPAVALAVGAHPDDVEFGCGATLAKWAARGTAVHHLVLTDGSRGSWDGATDTAALVRRRQEEQREAARRLGGGAVTFLGWPDGELEATLERRAAVCAEIRRVRPDVVLGHDPWRRYRLHPDHRHAGWLTVDAVVAARDPLFFPGEGGPAHRPRALLLWEADEPNHVEDAAGFEACKLDALLAHASQHRSTMGMDPGGDAGGFAARVRAQLADHGALAGLSLGEAFHLIESV